PGEAEDAGVEAVHEGGPEVVAEEEPQSGLPPLAEPFASSELEQGPEPGAVDEVEVEAVPEAGPVPTPEPVARPNPAPVPVPPGKKPKPKVKVRRVKSKRRPKAAEAEAPAPIPVSGETGEDEAAEKMPAAPSVQLPPVTTAPAEKITSRVK
ncbi:MAG: hypothetical protein GWO24_11610, partial [Akkermansiaceae bacterium]|nr:hypothetical protein [Akkermansiaceae bacterium]